jgi:hypothetical protein
MHKLDVIKCIKRSHLVHMVSIGFLELNEEGREDEEEDVG